MSENGRVLAVDESVVGSVATATASIGGSTITVEDPWVFDEGGGTLRHTGATNAGNVYAYTAVDLDTGVITLGETLDAAVAVDDGVRIEPLTVQRDAVVALADAPDTPILARVPHQLLPWMQPGVRELAEQESALVVERLPGDWVVTDVLGRGSASLGLDVVDITNEDGVPLLGGDPGQGVATVVFGMATELMLGRAENAGPVECSGTGALPTGASGNLRKIGRGGIDTDGVLLVLEQPAKVKAELFASVVNGSGAQFNLRMYCLVVDTDTSTNYPGRQTTSGVTSGATLHTQIGKTRLFGVPDATPENPRTLRLWWAFNQDTASGKAVFVRNMEMNLTISAAPSLPSAADPEREPQWAGDNSLKDLFQVLETEDIIT